MSTVEDPSASLDDLNSERKSGGGPRNEVLDPVDLNHTGFSFRQISRLLSEDLTEPAVYSERDGNKFGRLTGDNQGIHQSSELETLVAFHLASAGIMSEQGDLYSSYRERIQSGEDTINQEDAVEEITEVIRSFGGNEDIPFDYEPERIAQGVYSTARVVAQLEELVEDNPTAISAVHSDPVHYDGEYVVFDPNTDASDSDIPLRKFNSDQFSGDSIPDEEVESIFAEHSVLDSSSDEEVDYELMAYALTKGMSFEDRNGDVLIAFPYIEFTDYDRDNLEDLRLEERSLIEAEDDFKELDYVGPEILEKYQAVEEHMQGQIDDSVEVNFYKNVLTDQEGQKVMEYGEVDLQGVDYPEYSPSVGESVARLNRELISASPVGLLMSD